MRTRFVLLTNDPTRVEKDRISGLFREEKVGWWHWYQDVWIVNDSKGRSLKWWRDRLREESRGTHMLLLEIPKGATWSAAGHKKHFEWLHRNWKDPD